MSHDLKPYPVYKDSGVPWLGQMPEHWECKRLRNAANMLVSNIDKKSGDGELPVRLCNYVDVYKNERITESIKFMRATANADETRRFQLRLNDVLITKDSESWNDIGVPSLVEYTAPDLVCGYHLAILRPFQGIVDGEYLLRALQCQGVAYQFHVAANGVTRYGLSHDSIKSINITIPPLHEQAAIVRYLDYVDRRIRRYINARKKLIGLLNEQKQAIIQRAVTRGLDPNVRLKPSGVPWLGDVPEHWEVTRIKNVLRPIDKRSESGKETLLSLRRDHGIVVYSEHFSRPPQGATTIGFKLVQVDQLVVNRMQANNGLIFRSSLDGLVSPDYSVFQPITATNLDYLSSVLRTNTYRTYFRQEATGLGTGTSGFLRLYDDRFLNTPIAIPTYREQNELLFSLGKATTRLDETVEVIHREIATMNEYRTRLIADVVTGKLDVRAAAARLPEEPAEGETELEEALPVEEADEVAETDDTSGESE